MVLDFILCVVMRMMAKVDGAEGLRSLIVLLHYASGI